MMKKFLVLSLVVMMLCSCGGTRGGKDATGSAISGGAIKTEDVSFYQSNLDITRHEVKMSYTKDDGTNIVLTYTLSNKSSFLFNSGSVEELGYNSVYVTDLGGNTVGTVSFLTDYDLKDTSNARTYKGGTTSFNIVSDGTYSYVYDYCLNSDDSTKETKVTLMFQLDNPDDLDTILSKLNVTSTDSFNKDFQNPSMYTKSNKELAFKIKGNGYFTFQLPMESEYYFQRVDSAEPNAEEAGVYKNGKNVIVLRDDYDGTDFFDETYEDWTYKDSTFEYSGHIRNVEKNEFSDENEPPSQIVITDIKFIEGVSIMRGSITLAGGNEKKITEFLDSCMTYYVRED